MAIILINFKIKTNHYIKDLLEVEFMNDHSSKLFQFLSEKEIFKSSDIPSNAKAISINLDIGSLNISDGLEDL